MAKAKKASSTTKLEKTVVKPILLVTSDKCERCPHPCPAGISYIAKVNNGKFGKGVPCHQPW